MEKRREERIAPNGGWGWVVVFGVGLANMFNQSIVSCFGLLFGDKINQMGYGTTGAALVMNVTSMILNFTGLIAGPLLKKYSYRKVAIIGTCLVSIGMMLSSQATALWQLLITYSLFSGLGLGFLMPSTFLAVNTYFTTRKGKAVGFAMAGTGMGQMLMPHLIRYLLDVYGYSGTTLIVGALALNGVVGASLFHPVERHLKRQLNPEMDNLLKCSKLTPKIQYVGKSDPEASSDSEQANIKLKSIANEDQPHPKISIWRHISEVLDLNLLKKPIFVNITVGVSLSFTASTYFSMLFPFFLQGENIQLNRSQTAMCMSVLAGADIVARLTVPTLTQMCNIRGRITFMVGCGLLAAARTGLAFQTDYTHLIVLSILTGYVRASTVVYQNIVIAEYCTPETLPCGLGLNMVNKGLMVLTIGQFLGWVRDYTGSFMLGILTSNILLILIIITWAPEILYRQCKDKKRSSSVNNNTQLQPMG